MVINTAQNIDWFSVTYPSETKTKEILPQNARLEFVRSKSPIPVYSLCYEILPYGIIVLRGLERLGLHVIYSGQTLLALREDGVSDADIFETVIAHDGKLSRIDFALDIFDDEELNVNNIKAAFDNGECVTKLRRSKFIGEGHEHETLYIGNAKSRSRRFRIYNKAIEFDGNFLWVRIEYEKRKRAMVTARSHFHDGNSVASIIKGVVDFPHWQRWQDAFNAKPATIGRQEKTKAAGLEKVNWICDTCAPAIASAVLLESKSTENFVVEDSVVLNTFASILSAKLRERFH